MTLKSGLEVTEVIPLTNAFLTRQRALELHV